MRKREKITIKFLKQEEFPEISELSSFLREFKSVYSLITRAVESVSPPIESLCYSKDFAGKFERDRDIEFIRKETPSAIEKYLSLHHSYVGESHLPNRFFKMKEPKADKLSIVRISTESPLKIVVYGTLYGILLVLPVISVALSGGKIKFGDLFQFETNQSLAESVKDLKNVFKKPKRKNRERDE